MSPPATRKDIEIAIVCTLVHEYDAARLAFDKVHDTDLGRADGDHNMYKTGEIGGFNAVLLRLPNQGRGVAAGMTASLRSSYPNLKLVILTGICGGVPGAEALDGEELLLGDVVVSTTVVQYDLGRQEETGFKMKDAVESSLGRPVKYIRTFVAELEGAEERQKIEDKAAEYLTELQQKQRKMRRGPDKYKYPGPDNDKLFQSQYFHKHRQGDCQSCSATPEGICGDASAFTCTELGCDGQKLVPRERLETKKELISEGKVSEAQAPYIFVGRIGSGDTVVKSGAYRDTVARRHKLLAFEMEGSGIFDEIPCIVVKAVSDYSDSHKTKSWQIFGSAVAAAVTKALLADLYPKAPKDAEQNQAAANGLGNGRFGSPGSQTTFNGPITATNLVAGQSHNGGTTTYNFGS